jgi:hypothetical protein
MRRLGVVVVATVLVAGSACALVERSSSPGAQAGSSRAGTPSKAMRSDSTERCRELAVDGECGLRKGVRVDGQEAVLTPVRRGEGGGLVDVPALNDAVLGKLAERYESADCGTDCGYSLGEFEIGDFDGDTYADLAVTFQVYDLEMTDDRLGAGIVVMSGGPDGLRTDSLALVEAGRPPLGDELNVYESLWGVAVGDANGDGADDLAFVATPVDTEYVRAIVVYGSAQGLGADRPVETWHRDVPGVAGSNEPADDGGPVAFGDFDGDSYSDLVIGFPNDPGGRFGVIYGTGDGLTARRSQEWSKESPDVAGEAEGTDGLGYSLAVGDFNGDGADDFAAGSRVVGDVLVLYGGGDGLTAGGSQHWPPEGDGLPTGGGALSIGWFGGSEDIDLAVVDTRTGTRKVLFGSPDGLVAN